MAAKRKKLFWLFALVALLFATATFASIPKPDTLLQPSIDRFTIDISQETFEEVPQRCLSPLAGVVDLERAAEAEVLLHAALEASVPVPAHAEILSESRVWGSAFFVPLFPQEPGELSLDLRQAYADVSAGRASDRTVLTPDPLGYRDSSNLYAFAGGDPVNGRDPTGLCIGNLPCPRWLSKAADDLSTFYDSKAGHAVVAIGKGAAVVGGAGVLAVGAVAAAPVIALAAGATEATAVLVGSITATTVTAAGFGAAAHQVVWSSINRYGEDGKVGRAMGLGISDATGATGIAEGITELDTSSGARLSKQEAGDRLGKGSVQAAATALLVASAARIATSRAQDPDALFARSNPRRGAERAAMNTAPKTASGEPICETCGTILPKQITLGSRLVRGFQMDHFRLTFAQRIQALMLRPVWPARSTVLDYNNMGLRPLCAPCNLGHAWEGQVGPFATGANPGLSAIPLDPANAAATAIAGSQIGLVVQD